MARLFQTSWAQGSLTSEGTTTSGSPSLQSTVKHGEGPNCIEITALVSGTAKYVAFQFASAASAGPYYFRFFLRVHSNPNVNTKIFSLGAVVGGTVNAGLQLKTDGTLQLLGGTNGPIGSPTAALTADTWHCIEVFINATPASGSRVITARLNGVQFATSSVETSTTCAAVDFVNLGGNISAGTATAGDWFIADLAINDSTGTGQTSWPGPGSIIEIQPNALGDNDGFLTQVGGTAGTTNNFTRVDELVSDTTTSYNASATISVIDDHKFASVPAGLKSGSTINVVAVGGEFGGASSSLNSSFKFRLKKAAAGTVASSAAITPTSTTMVVNAIAAPSNYPLVTYLDPDSGAWTVSTLNTLQAGYTISTASTNAARISTLWVSIDFKYPTTTCTAPASMALGSVALTQSAPASMQLSTSGVTCTAPASMQLSTNGNTRTAPANMALGSVGLTLTAPTSAALGSVGLARSAPASMQLSAIVVGATRTAPAAMELSTSGNTRTAPASMALRTISHAQNAPTSMALLVTTNRLSPASMSLSTVGATRTAPASMALGSIALARTSLASMALLTITNQRTAPASAALRVVGASRTAPASMELSVVGTTRTSPVSMGIQTTTSRTAPASMALQPRFNRTAPASMALRVTQPIVVAPASAALQTSNARSSPASFATQATASCIAPASMELSSIGLARLAPVSIGLLVSGKDRTTPASMGLSTTTTLTSPASMALGQTLARVSPVSTGLRTSNQVVAPASMALQTTASCLAPTSMTLSTSTTRTTPALMGLGIVGNARTAPASMELSFTQSYSVLAPASMALGTTQAVVAPVSMTLQRTSRCLAPASMALTALNLTATAPAALGLGSERNQAVAPASVALRVTSRVVAPASMQLAPSSQRVYAPAWMQLATTGNQAVAPASMELFVLETGIKTATIEARPTSHSSLLSATASPYRTFLDAELSVPYGAIEAIMTSVGASIESTDTLHSIVIARE